METLLLADNKIASLGSLATGAPGLQALVLSNNKIAALDDLAPLAGLHSLSSLDLEGCPVSSVPDFRDAVFKLVPSLRTLNSADASGEPCEDDDDDEEDEACRSSLHPALSLRSEGALFAAGRGRGG